MKEKIAESIISISASLALPFYRKGIEDSIKERWMAFGIESSNICNANCSFCGYGKNMDGRKKSFVDFKVLKHTLDLYQKAGGGDFNFGSILGDPLADREFLKKVKFIRSYAAVKRISTFTNLIGLDNFNVEDFVKSGLTDIAVSTAIGDEKIFKKLFGVDLYHKTMKNIMVLLETNRRLGNPIKIIMLLRTDYDNIADLRHSEEYRRIRQFLGEDDITTIEKDEWDDYDGTVKKADLPKYAEFKANPKNKRIPCYGLYRKVQILKDGEISMCSCRVSPELVIDNIFKYDSLTDYWKGERLNLIRSRWQSGDIPPFCRRCSHYMPYTNLIKGKMRHAILTSLLRRGKC
ncbi:MAG: radical SAM protein [Candidatus Omnitrophica bacterium]|nr:radical SAM protein [Candidatus Omnitrophota bacterium]